MIVRDGARVVERALRPLRGIADESHGLEVCIVDTGSTDGTPDVIRKICTDLGMSFSGIAVSPVSRPDLYFLDVPETYHPHAVPEMTGQPLLRDWAAARNLGFAPVGLGQCRGRYVMKLDADDEFMTPENILPTLDRLDQSPDIDLVACPYEIMDGRGQTDYVTMYTRLWRNKPEIFFREVCHDNVDWCRRPDGANWIMTNEALYARDWRDNVGNGTRAPHRNLKTFLAEYVRCKRGGVEPSPHVLIYMADEAAEVMPTLALSVLDELEPVALEPVALQLGHSTDVAWMNFIRARCFEHMGLFTDASYYYRKASRLGFGWERAKLRCALMLARRGEQGWRKLLELAIDANEGRFYPRYASVIEVAMAKKLIEEG